MEIQQKEQNINIEYPDNKSHIQHRKHLVRYPNFVQIKEFKRCKGTNLSNCDATTQGIGSLKQHAFTRNRTNKSVG